MHFYSCHQDIRIGSPVLHSSPSSALPQQHLYLHLLKLAEDTTLICPAALPFVGVWFSADCCQFRRTFYSQSGSHPVLEADGLLSLNLHSAVVASTVLQVGTVDPQRQVMFPWAALQPVALVLMGPWFTDGCPRLDGAAVQDHSTMTVS